MNVGKCEIPIQYFLFGPLNTCILKLYCRHYGLPSFNVGLEVQISITDKVSDAEYFCSFSYFNNNNNVNI